MYAGDVGSVVSTAAAAIVPPDRPGSVPTALPPGGIARGTGSGGGAVTSRVVATSKGITTLKYTAGQCSLPVAEDPELSPAAIRAGLETLAQRIMQARRGGPAGEQTCVICDSDACS